MTVRTLADRMVVPKIVFEGTPLRIAADLIKVMVDTPDAPLLPADLAGPMTVTIFSLDDPAFPIVNAIEDVDLIATGMGTLHATTGRLSLLLGDADNAVLDQALAVERHCVRIRVPYSLAPLLTCVVELEVRVRNLALVPVGP